MLTALFLNSPSFKNFFDLPLICSRQSNFEFEYFGKFEIKFENILGHELGSQAGSFDEKKPEVENLVLF